MHGTIVVLAATTATTPSQRSTSGSGRSHSSSATTPGTPARASSRQTLPMTGLNVIAGLFYGVLLIGLGLALRPALHNKHAAALTLTMAVREQPSWETSGGVERQ